MSPVATTTVGFVLDANRTSRLAPSDRAWLLQAVSAVADAATMVGRAGTVVPLAYLPVAVAQSCLESAWGAHMPPDSHNPFGIKAHPGDPHVDAMTWEHVDGHDVRVVQSFRAFPSLADAFVRHCRLLCTAPIYAPVRAHANDPIAFATALTGRYASDPHYADKIIRIMRDTGLLHTFGFPEHA